MNAKAFILCIPLSILILPACSPIKNTSHQPGITTVAMPQSTQTTLHQPSITSEPTQTVTTQIVPSQTNATLAVSSEINNFFAEFLDVQEQNWNVNLQLRNLAFENMGNGNLTLQATIQCLPALSPCEQWMPRWAFFFVFANPEPQPGDLAFFPAELSGFTVFCYDKNMNLIDSFAGNWSDILLYEQNLIPDDELEARLFQP